MRSCFRLLLAALAGVIVVQLHASAQQKDPHAVLQPGMRYDIVIRKAIGGNDGFKEVVPTTSTQTVVIETGKPAGGLLPATLTIYRNQRTDKPGTPTIGHLVEWRIEFTVSTSGVIGNVKAAEGETGLAAPLVRSLMMKHLAGILFVTPYALEVKNLPVVSIISSVPRAGGVLVDVTYSATKPDAEIAASSQPIAETIGGEAVYDASAKFFTSRTQRQTTNIYLADNDYEKAKTVKMTENTTWQVTVTRR